MSFTVPDAVLSEIAEQLTKRKPPSAANEDLRDAWFGIDELSVGPAGANFSAWFTYWDGTKVHITLAEGMAQSGTATANMIPAWVRLPPPEKLPSRMYFDASGFWFSGTLVLESVGNFTLVGAAPADWHLAGYVKFEKP